MPTLLPGFLRRTLRLGYDEEEEVVGEDDNGGDDNNDEEQTIESSSSMNNNNNNSKRNNNNKTESNNTKSTTSSKTTTTITTATTTKAITPTKATTPTKTGGSTNKSPAKNDNLRKNDQRNDNIILQQEGKNKNASGTTAQQPLNSNSNSFDNNNNVNNSYDDDEYDEEEFTLKTISRHPYKQQEELNNDQQQQEQEQLQMSVSSSNSSSNTSSSAWPKDSLKISSHHNSPRLSSQTSSGSFSNQNNNNNSMNNINNNMNNNTNNKKTYKEIQFEKILKQDVINLHELSTLSWNGIPIQYRAITWKLLLHYVPTNVLRRDNTLRRKRNEYYDIYVTQHYNSDTDDDRTIQEQEILRQVLVDVPRTQPNIPLFRNDKIKKLLSRLLYIWAMRHPASSYVQGINDLTTPLVIVFLTDYFINSNNNNNNNNIDENNNNNNNNSVIFDENNMINRALVNDDDNDDDDDDDNDNSNNNSTNINNSNHNNGMTENDNIDDERQSISDSIRSSRYNSNDYDVSVTSSTHSNQNYIIDNQYDFYRILPDIVLEGHVMNHISDDKLKELEADIYWCLTSLLSGIQDHYTNDQPGIQRMVGRLEELMNRIDNELCQHLYNTGILFIQFAFKWMNCLLLREITLKCIIRLWDTYLSEDNQCGFEDFHVYVCASFLCQFSIQLQDMTFDELFIFFQNIPVTKDWNDNDIEILLSQAYVLSTLFRNSDAHLTCVSNNNR